MNPYKRIRATDINRPSMDEHRAIKQRELGRPLDRFEFVHHVNGDKRDNRPENLEVVTPKQHAFEHGQWKHPAAKICEVCGTWFEPSPTKRATKKTCSKVCRYALTAKTQSKPDAPRSRHRRSPPSSSAQ